jgi:glycosyltransferase involved in cell wall biosynthesis
VRAPIALVPNGIDPLERVAAAEFLATFPELAGKVIVLFLGRVHHKKGVLNLLRAWSLVSPRRSGAHLVIAGPEYADTGARVRQIIKECHLENEVTLTGVISGTLKLSALSAAKYFCLPSYSEGLSVAVLEALAIGLPPIVTPECNIPQVASSGAGVCTSNDPAALAATLKSCLDLSFRDWQEMSGAAHNLARSQFNWNNVGESMYSVYQWLLGGNRPACLVTAG